MSSARTEEGRTHARMDRQKEEHIVPLGGSRATVKDRSKVLTYTFPHRGHVRDLVLDVGSVEGELRLEIKLVQQGSAQEVVSNYELAEGSMELEKLEVVSDQKLTATVRGLGTATELNLSGTYKYWI